MIHLASFRELTSELHASRLDELAIAEHVLARIEVLNPKLGCLSAVEPSFVRDTALLRRDTRATRGIGRLQGVPFSAKENIDVAGLPVGSASKRYPATVATQDAAIIARLLSEGAMCVGKGNMPERAKSYSSENLVNGRTSNPFNPEFTPGGSSGGDAAAVAAGFATFAVGSDAGGSIRVPANFCGVFGLLPTGGLFPESGLSLGDTFISRVLRRKGLIARHLDDLRILTQILSVYDQDDPQSAPVGGLPEGSLKRFAFFKQIDDTRSAPEIVAALDSVVERLRALGWQGVELCPAPLIEALEPAVILLGQANLELEDLLLSRAAAVPGAPESPQLVGLRSRVSTELPPLTAKRLMLALQRVYQIRQEMAGFFQRYDFLLCPVAASLPAKHGVSSYRAGDQSYTSEYAFRFSSALNVAGVPAIAFPTGLSDDGLPVGLQIAGPRFSERRMMLVLQSLGISTALKAPIA